MVKRQARIDQIAQPTEFLTRLSEFAGPSHHWHERKHPAPSTIARKTNAPAGKIGEATTERLLKAGTKVTIISRHPEKVAGLVECGSRSIGDPLMTDRYYLERLAQGWRVYDIEVDGISPVADFRNSFAVGVGRSPHSRRLA